MKPIIKTVDDMMKLLEEVKRRIGGDAPVAVYDTFGSLKLTVNDQIGITKTDDGKGKQLSIGTTSPQDYEYIETSQTYQMRTNAYDFIISFNPQKTRAVIFDENDIYEIYGCLCNDLTTDQLLEMNYTALEECGELKDDFAVIDFDLSDAEIVRGV